MKRRILAAALIAFGSWAFAGGVSSYVWLEAEDYAWCNFKHFEVSTMGKPQLLSAGKWIMKGMGPQEVKRLVPDEGILLRYRLKAPKAGRYIFWARIGWFRARADFQWRLGDGPWHDVPRTYPTRNLMELGFFCEVSWANLGQVELPAGPTTLEIRFPKTRGPKDRMLCALDCFAFIHGPFTPEGPFRPGETYSSEKDLAAARQVFELPPPNGPGRTQVVLNGLWQVARYDDPDMDTDTYVPVRRLPSPEEYQLRWMGFEVPGNPWNCPPLVFGHRLIYRTRVRVPASHRGRGFKLHFSGTNWIVSVFVNGKLAGTHRGVWVPWDLDVSRFIVPGKVNELAVAVKGTYYAFDAKAMGGAGKIHPIRNRPLSRKRWTRWVAPIYPSTKGDGDGYVYGIVNPVTLVSVGPVYTEDVFIKPSVARKELGLEITVRNTTDAPHTVAIRCEAINDKTNQVEKTFDLPPVALAPRQVRTVAFAGRWSNPKLWWPVPNPDLYRLRITVAEGDKPLDVHEELFGFREVTIKGTGIYINGLRRNLWCWVDVHKRWIARPEGWVECWRQEGNRFVRFSQNRRISRVLRTREERLEFYDRNGIPGRLCTMIDGMFISYNLGKRTRTPDGKPLLIPNEPVWEGFRRHMAQVAKAYRNHPSVIFYQVENELVYINGMNIYGAYLDKIEELMNQVVEAGRKLDPTRRYTVGGGGDLSGRLEINCPHYPTAPLDYYPENAYTLEHYSTKIQRWPWRRKKPWVVGESLFADELRLGAYALGDQVFRSKRDALRGKARFLRAVYGGYRWAGVAGFFPWDNLRQFDDTRKVFSDLYACPRKQTHRLRAGAENRLLFKILNDTLSDAPITFEWDYAVGGKRIAGERLTMKIEPGFGKEYVISIKAPPAEHRLDGTFRLRLGQSGAKDYVDERLVPVLPKPKLPKVGVPVWVFDRKGALTDFLRKARLAFNRLESLDDLEGKSGLLLIGHDTLTPREAYGTKLLAFAATGGRVICLEQDHPLAGAALPAPIRPTERFGGYAHPQALGTPLFRDLGPDDLIDWAGDHPTYKNAYAKPASGARSLAECGGNLDLSPLLEVPCGKGVIVLCQLRVGAKLAVEPAAGILLRNLVADYGNYRPATGVAAIFAPDDTLLVAKAQACGAMTRKVASLAEALDPAAFKVAIVHATEENLKTLLRLGAKARAFQEAGGWIMLNGLGPKGSEEFNALVGANHMLRPFRIERVTLENRTHPLAATLGNRDVALYSPKPLLHGRYWVSGNTYSYVIDGQDFAPFTLPPGAPDDPYAYKPTGDDHDPYNFVNGMFNDDFWRYIRQIWVDTTNPDRPIGLTHTFRLRRPDVLKQINIWNNANYSTIEKLDIVLDGDRAHPISVVLPDSYDKTEVVLPEPRRVERTITLVIRTWRIKPHSHPQAGHLVGIDNVQFLRPAPPRGAVFLDNVGGLVVFPRGKGGVFLNQVKFMAEEPRPENARKKLRILAVLLQNMGVGFRSTEAVAVPGLNVRFHTVNLQEHCTWYLDDRSGKPGWFGTKGQNLENLPRGRGVFASVPFHVVDYRTAPIPDCIVAGGPRAQPSSLRRLPSRVEGIPVGAKADVLYFLHTANVTRPITDRERERMKSRRRPFALPTILKYVLHYQDGAKAEIPVVLERHIAHWLQDQAEPLSGAQIGWSRPVAGGKRAVLYLMQARNPRPEATITAIDVARTSDRATPAVIGITLGTVVK